MKTLQNFLFVLKRFKTSSILNILGLSVAFAVFSITMIQTHYDLSYDKNYTRARDIYLYSNIWKNYDNQLFGINNSVAQAIVNQFPEVETCCMLDWGWGEEKIELQGNPDASFRFPLMKVNEGFLDVFTPQILSGDARQVFTEQDKAMLTDDVAQILFGKENPIGKVIMKDTIAYTVVAVCKHFPANCSMKNGIFTNFSVARDYKEMGLFNYMGYFLIHPKDIPSLQKKLNSPEFLKINEIIARIELVPLSDVYFSKSKISGKGNPGNLATTISLMAIGVLILVIAFINFINFAVAMIPSRVRGMNIKKILGSDAWKLKLIVASEAPCFALLAFGLSLFLIVLFKTTNLNDFFPANLSLEKNRGILSLIAITGMIISLLFGIYPAGRVTSYQPAMALSGSFAQSKKSAFLRNVLITVQFFFAVVLIIIAIFIKLQHDYMTNYSWGIQKENVVYLPIKGDADLDANTFMSELKQNPNILDYTVSEDLPGRLGRNYKRKLQDKEVWFTAWLVKSNFLDFFGIEVIEGRDFIPDDDGKSRAIFNQTFFKKYDFVDIIGSTMEDNRGIDVVGVSKDVNFESLHSEIRPLCFITQDLEHRFKWLFIKISGNNIRQTMDYITTTWEKLSDEPVDLHFLDATMDKLYEKESNLAKLISIFGVIAVIIAVMGVYGLIVFNAKYKQKEIAIRKVNGSTIKEIMLMLNRNILMQLGIAFVIAVPVAYFIVQKWLESFAYKMPIYWWVFLLGGMIILLITVITVSAQSYKAAKRNPTRALNSD
jgi:putative ABC transport system permease protein